MKVSDLMAADPTAAAPGWSLAKAGARMEELAARHLAVLEGGRVVGVISERDLLEATGGLPERAGDGDGSPKVVRDFMSVPAVTAAADDDVEDALGTLLERRIGCLPVLDGGGRLAGMLSVIEVLAAHVRASSAPRAGALDGVIAERMSEAPVTLDAGATAGEALAACRKLGVRHLPVTADGWFVGLVSDRDLRRAAGAGTLERPLGAIMTRHVTTLGPESLLSDAAELMLRARVGSIPVTSEGRLVGMLTTTDLLAFLRERLAAGAAILA